MPSKIENLKPSTFETIDAAMLEWINDVLDVRTKTNEGFKKVPVIWLTSERAFQIKQNKELRSVESDALIFPLITVERSSVEKTEVGKRPIPGNLQPIDDYRGGTSFTISRRIKQDKTRNFANARATKLYEQQTFPFKNAFGNTIENEKIVYQTMTIPMPVYYNMTYTINLRSDYQQQMNQMMQPFMVYAGGINQFVVRKDEYNYEAFIDPSYTLDNNLSSLGEEEKKYETQVKINVLGFIYGSGINDNKPHVVIRENPVEIRFPRETVMLGDINEYSIKEGSEQEPYVPRFTGKKNPYKS